MAFSRGATGLSHLPSCSELILEVTVESLQGRRVYLECIWTSGSLEILARPLEFMSRVKLIPTPLVVRRERRHSFPGEVEKWILLSRSGGKTEALLQLWWDPRYSSQLETGMSGNFLSCLKGVKDPFEA